MIEKKEEKGGEIEGNKYKSIMLDALMAHQQEMLLRLEEQIPKMEEELNTARKLKEQVCYVLKVLHVIKGAEQMKGNVLKKIMIEGETSKKKENDKIGDIEE